jgi:hypothetical protein
MEITTSITWIVMVLIATLWQVESRRILTPHVHPDVTGIYHGDGLYPAELGKHPQFLLLSCRAPTGWCKRRLEPYEVLSLYDISDSVTLVMNPDLKSNIIYIQHLTPVAILLSAAIAVITEVWRGG